jgi:peptidoglycan/LPS O-acetylase OafA/YrhL
MPVTAAVGKLPGNSIDSKRIASRERFQYEPRGLSTAGRKLLGLQNQSSAGGPAPVRMGESITMRYRPDIDGMRALAVSSVVFSHADVRALAGGFLGVDVFFVISGFLITNLIASDIESKTYSIAAFYERRVRRIIPAAAVVLVASTACAWFMLLPYPFAEFCKSLIAAELFSSNWYFLNDVSYFAAPAATKPLLHTWTLSIEEQFYLVFPLVMVVLVTPTRRFAGLGVLCLASILYARWLGSAAGGFDAAFYNSFSRAFELLIGCLTAIAYRSYSPHRWLSLALRTGGLGLVGFAVLIQGATDYKHMLVPCVGAAAFLFARPDDRDPVFKIVASPPFRAVGVLSYSIYLWHWPVLVFSRIYFGELDGATTAAVIAATVLLSALTLYAVENPIRHGRFLAGQRLKVFAIAGASTAAIASFAILAIARDGLPGRLPPKVIAMTAAATPSDARLTQCFRPPGGPAESVAMAEDDTICRIGDRSRKTIDFILWGDSHAFAMSQAVSELAADAGLQGVVAMIAGCPSLSGTVSSDLGRAQKCPAFYRAVSKLIERHNIRQILMVDRWSLYVEGEPSAASEGYLKFADDWDRRTDPKHVFSVSLERTAAEFADRQVIFMKEPPLQSLYVTEAVAVNALMGFPASRLDTRWTTRQAHLERYAFLNREFDTVMMKFGNVVVLDPLPYLCDNNFCAAAKDDLPLYMDKNHLNVLGARLLKPMFAAVLRQMKAATVGP